MATAPSVTPGENPFQEGALSTEAMAARTAKLWMSSATNKMQLPSHLLAADKDGDGTIDKTEFFSHFGVEATYLRTEA